jgi:hypothetical protein
MRLDCAETALLRVTLRRAGARIRRAGPLLTRRKIVGLVLLGGTAAADT